MKKHYYILSLAALAIAFLPAVSRAHETGEPHEHADIEIESHVESNSSSTITTSGSIKLQQGIGEQIRLKAQNLRDGKLVRQDILNRGNGTSSKEARTDLRNERQAERKLFVASSTAARKEIHREMRADVFQARKEAIIRQLTISLNNLKQIRERLSSRISKAESSGRNMTDAKNALVIADAKISAAGQAINAIGSVSVGTSTSATTTASTTIDLGKPRQIAETAIKAIKDAQKALVDVVKAVAKNMGLKLGSQATTTVSVTATTTTATTTATTTTETTSTTTATSTP